MGMMVARAEQAEVALCGSGGLKIAELAAGEGTLQTALRLRAQVQVGRSPPPPTHTGRTQARSIPDSGGMSVQAVGDSPADRGLSR